MVQDFSIKANRNLGNAFAGLNRTLEQLSSGLRINRAKDDAAGLAILSQLEANDKSRGAVERNLGDAVSFTGIQDGALGQIQSSIERLGELSIQAANGTISDDQRATLQTEYSALVGEIERIAQTAQFNGTNVLSGQSTTIQSGIGSDANSQTTIGKIDISQLISDIQAGSISTASNAQTAIGAIDTFRASLNQAVGNLGATQSTLSRLSEVNSTLRQNEAEAASRIRDADAASLAADRVKYDILAQSSLAIVAQAGKLQANVAAALLS